MPWWPKRKPRKSSGPNRSPKGGRTMTDTLMPCPFCGSTKIGQASDGKFKVAWCRSCGAHGPSNYFSLQDGVSWNIRPANTDPMTIAKYDDDLRKAAGVWRDMESAPKDNQYNLGYAEGFNLGIERAAEYVRHLSVGHSREILQLREKSDD